MVKATNFKFCLIGASLLLVTSFRITAQMDFSGQIAAYKNYFLFPHEQVYTHFNKSCYLPGDDIWFTNYVIDQTISLPCKQTRMLYVELFNPQGKLLEQKILNVQGGVAFNSFKINDNLPGRYTFRAYTNGMKNFHSPDDFVTEIEVIGNTNKDSLVNHPSYDVQFLPESGALLAGV